MCEDINLNILSPNFFRVFYMFTLSFIKFGKSLDFFFVETKNLKVPKLKKSLDKQGKL